MRNPIDHMAEGQNELLNDQTDGVGGEADFGPGEDGCCSTISGEHRPGPNGVCVMCGCAVIQEGWGEETLAEAYADFVNSEAFLAETALWEEKKTPK